MPKTQNIQRLLSLSLTLAASKNALSRTELTALIGYSAANPDTARRQFNRDLALLQNLGFELATILEPGDDHKAKYRLLQPQQQLQAEFEDYEQAILIAATEYLSPPGLQGIGSRIRGKLAANAIRLAEPLKVNFASNRVASINNSLLYSVLLQASLESQQVSFKYQAKPGEELNERIIEPWIVGSVKAREYVYGYDLVRKSPRLFRLSRIQNHPTLLKAATHPKPPSLAPLSKLVESENESKDRDKQAPPILVKAKAYKALDLRKIAGAGIEAESFTLKAGEEILQLALSEAGWVKLSGENDVVTTWRGIMQKIAESHAGEAALTETELAELEALSQPKIRQVSSADDEFTRLSSLISYLQKFPGTHLHQIAEDFGISEEQLSADLEKIDNVAEYSRGIDNYLDVCIDEGYVSINQLLYPALQLTQTDLLALIAVIHSQPEFELGISAFTPAQIQSTLAKLTRLLPKIQASELSNLPNSGYQVPQSNELLNQLTNSLQQQSVIRIRYSSANQALSSIRDITVQEIYADKGKVFIKAFCESAGDIRNFRLDRISEFWLADKDAPAVQIAAKSSTDESYAWVKVGPQGSWILDAFNTEELKQRDGVTYAKISSSSPSAIVSAAFESKGGVEILYPKKLRDQIKTVADYSLLNIKE